jgi:hypothetical protein
VAHNRVTAGLAVLVAVITPVCTTARPANDQAPGQLPGLTKQVRYGDIDLLVPGDWVALGGTMTVEPFSSPRGRDAPAMSRYYHGSWKTARSAPGLLLEIGTTVSVLDLGHGAVLFTEWVRVPAYNVGLGLSGPGRTESQGLALARAVLLTARAPT